MIHGCPQVLVTRRSYNDGEVGPRLTRVCHCVLLWVFDVGQDVKDEQGRNKNAVISITLPAKEQSKRQHPKRRIKWNL